MENASGQQDARLDDPIVVVGTFRSASTLVAELLGSRPDRHYLGFELSEQMSEATGVPFAAPGADDRRCPALDRDDATPSQSVALGQLLRDRADEEGVGPAQRLVVKNPHLWHRLGWIRALLPSCRVVVTVRDLRPTVASLKVLWERSLDQHGHVHHLPEQDDRCWDYLPRSQRGGFDPRRTFPGGDVTVLAEFWLRANSRLADAVRRGAVEAVVRHEDTLATPELTSARLQRDLGLEPTPIHAPEPIEPARQSQWRDRLTASERAALEGFVREHRQELEDVRRVLQG